MSGVRHAQPGKAVERFRDTGFKHSHVASDRWNLPATQCPTLRARLLPPAVITIRRAESSVEIKQALDLLQAHSAAQDRATQVEEALASGAASHPDEFMLLAERRGQTVGSLLAIIRPGRTAFVWPPSVIAGDHADAAADALLSECGRNLDAAGVVVGQALLESADFVGRDAFTRNGFPYLTTMHLLVRSLDDPIPPRFDGAWSGHSYTPDGHLRFAKLLERTCVASLDCSELHAVVRGDDALDLHRASGEFDPRFWLRVEVGTCDAGLVLVNPHPNLNACEVSYLGVVPEFRGKGLGRELLIEALHLSEQAGFSELFLAVDEKNHFARKVYHGLGFSERECRAVHLRTGPRSDSR